MAARADTVAENQIGQAKSCDFARNVSIWTATDLI